VTLKLAILLIGDDLSTEIGFGDEVCWTAVAAEVPGRRDFIASILTTLVDGQKYLERN
jgi:hypothetical protein